MVHRSASTTQQHLDTPSTLSSEIIADPSNGLLLYEKQQPHASTTIQQLSAQSEPPPTSTFPQLPPPDPSSTQPIHSLLPPLSSCAADQPAVTPTPLLSDVPHQASSNHVANSANDIPDAAPRPRKITRSRLSLDQNRSTEKTRLTANPLRSSRNSIAVASSSSSSSSSSACSRSTEDLCRVDDANGRAAKHSDSKSVPCSPMPLRRALMSDNGHGSLANNTSTTSPAAGRQKKCAKSLVFSEPKLLAPVSRAGGIVCSVSLDRIPGFAETLSQLQKRLDRGTSVSSPCIAMDKTLCLYCERSFSSHKLYAKHSERVHQSSGEGRRLSSRNSNTEPAFQAFAGCFYCNAGKLAALQADELPRLFKHLCDHHMDKYFACRLCLVRFVTAEVLHDHQQQFHPREATRAIALKSETSRSSADLESLDDTTSSSLTPIAKYDEDTTAADESLDAAVAQQTLRSSRRQQALLLAAQKQPTATTLRKKQMLRNQDTLLSRLGITQNRTTRTRRGCLKPITSAAATATRAEGALRSETPSNRAKKNNRMSAAAAGSAAAFAGGDGSNGGDAANISPLAAVSGRIIFDENFYESVNANVRQNLSCHIDGKLEGGPSPRGPVQAVPSVRSTLVCSPAVAENEIHEATALAALTAFPTLLTAQQYGAEPMPSGKMKKPITKNSWKWKWDCVRKYKYVNEGGKFVKKIKQPMAGLRDLSKLDMWTQLTMRSKHERIVQQSGCDKQLIGVGEVMRQEKRRLITQLDDILDSRILPKINLEQNDQRIVKLEVDDDTASTPSAPSTPVKTTNAAPAATADDLPSSLLLVRRDSTTERNCRPIVLSGEWARPRCYICVGCGARFENMKMLDDHKQSRHPHVQSTHYEIVGKELMDGNLFRHFFIPANALQRHSEHLRRRSSPAVVAIDAKESMVEDSMDSHASFAKSDSFDTDSNSRNSKISSSSSTTQRNSTPTSSSAASSIASNDPLRKLCTKCQKPCNGLMELYRHMLDCAGDYAWQLAKKRQHLRHRYFGTRRRRAQRANRRDRQAGPKPERTRLRVPQAARQRPSDAESIQRMLADLPAKRACHQTPPNTSAPNPNQSTVSANTSSPASTVVPSSATPPPTKPAARKLVPTSNSTTSLVRSGGRKQILIKQSAGGKASRRFVATASTTVASIAKNMQMRKQKQLGSKNVHVTNEQHQNVVVADAGETNTSDLGRSTRSNQLKDNERVDQVQGAKKSNVLFKSIRRKTQRVVSKIAESLRNKKPSSTLSDEDLETDPQDEDLNNDASDKISKKESTNKKGFFRKTMSFRKSKRLVEAVNVDPTQEETAIEVAIPKQRPETNSTVIDKKTRASKVSDESESIIIDAPIVLVEPEISASPTLVPAISTTLSLTVLTFSPPDVTVSTLPLPSPVAHMLVSPSPSNSSIPQSPSPGMKRRPRKLNDCIAMLTGKLTEKLGVPFLESEPINVPKPVPPTVLNVPSIPKVHAFLAGQEMPKARPITRTTLTIPTYPVPLPAIVLPVSSNPDDSVILDLSIPKSTIPTTPPKLQTEPQPPPFISPTPTPKRRTPRKPRNQRSNSIGPYQELIIPTPPSSKLNTQPNNPNAPAPPVRDTISEIIFAVSRGEDSTERPVQPPTPPSIPSPYVSPLSVSIVNPLDVCEADMIPVFMIPTGLEPTSTKNSSTPLLETTLVPLISDTFASSRIKLKPMSELLAPTPIPAKNTRSRRSAKKAPAFDAELLNHSEEDTSLVVSTPCQGDEDGDIPIEVASSDVVVPEAIAPTVESTVPNCPDADENIIIPALTISEMVEVPKTTRSTRRAARSSQSSTPIPIEQSPLESVEIVPVLPPVDAPKSAKRPSKKGKVTPTLPDQLSEPLVSDAASPADNQSDSATIEHSNALNSAHNKSTESENLRQKRVNFEESTEAISTQSVELVVEDATKDGKELLTEDLRTSKSKKPSVQKKKKAKKRIHAKAAVVEVAAENVTPESALNNRNDCNNISELQCSLDEILVADSALASPHNPTEHARSTPKRTSKNRSVSKGSSITASPENLQIDEPSTVETSLIDCTSESHPLHSSTSAITHIAKITDSSKPTETTMQDLNQPIDGPPTTPIVEQSQLVTQATAAEKISTHIETKSDTNPLSVLPTKKRAGRPRSTQPKSAKSAAKQTSDELFINLRNSSTNEVNSLSPSTECNVRKKNSTTSAQITNPFDSGDEEFHPWDPEVGLVISPTATAATTSALAVNKEVSLTQPSTSEPTIVTSEIITASISTPLLVPNKQRKRRKNELAKIIADQLLESFKQVDQSRIGELKLLHDISIDSASDDNLLRSTMSYTPPPKRKSSSKVSDDIAAAAVAAAASTATDHKGSESDASTGKKRGRPLLPAVAKNIKSILSMDAKRGKADKKKRGAIRFNLDPDKNGGGHQSDTEVVQPTPKPPAKIMSRRQTFCSERVVAPLPIEKIKKQTAKKKSLTFGKLKLDVPATHLPTVLSQKVECAKVPKKIRTSRRSIDIDFPSRLKRTHKSKSSNVDSKTKKSTVSIDMVAQIISDFTTSTIDSRNNSPVVFSDNLNQDSSLTTSLPNGIDKPKNRALELLRHTDKLGNLKSPLRAPFMSPRWEADEATPNAPKSEKPIPSWHTLSANALIEEPMMLPEKSLLKSLKNKTKSLLGLSKNKSKKASSVHSPPLDTVKRPLLRPSILNGTLNGGLIDKTKVNDEELLRNFEKSDLFLGKDRGFANNEPVPNIFAMVETKATKSMSFDAVKASAVTVRGSEVKDLSMVAKSVTNPIKTNKPTRKMGSVRKRPNRKSTPTPSSDHLNTAFISDNRIATPLSNPPKVPIALSVVDQELLHFDCSQDTVLSAIVNRIQNTEEPDNSDDEDLCLSTIAKTLNSKLMTTDEFNNEESPPVDSPTIFKMPSDFDNLRTTDAMPTTASNHSDTTVPQVIADVINDCVDMDENTNTDLVDMDLEDSLSAYTSFSMDTTVTSGGGRKKKRRSRKSVISKSSRKAKRIEDQFLLPNSFHCAICDKPFSSQSALTSHKSTLKHISKLSEQEFLQSKETLHKKVDREELTIIDTPDTNAELPCGTETRASPGLPQQPPPEQLVEPAKTASLPPKIMTPTTLASPVRIPPPLLSNTYRPSGIESISSPEQPDHHTSDRYTIHPRLALPMLGSPRQVLSQEERLFYECCSMLKGSERRVSDSPPLYYQLPRIHSSEMIMANNKPVTPRSNEQYSYVVPEGSKGKGTPKIDLNQFSDISSDSNPAYSCPQIPSSSADTQQNSFARQHKVTTTTGLFANAYVSYGSQPRDNLSSYPTNTSAAMENVASAKSHVPAAKHSDIGDSFQSSQDAIENVEHFGRGLVGRAAANCPTAAGSSGALTFERILDRDRQKAAPEAAVVASSSLIQDLPAGLCTNRSPFESPLHSASSQSSTVSKPRTKGAMKGYENFKVSIPTTGIDIEQALNRSPNPTGCKLAALADIALGNDVPHAVGLIPSVTSDVESSKTGFQERPAAASEMRVTVAADKVDQSKIKEAKSTHSKGASIGNKLGFNHRKKKVSTHRSKAQGTPSSMASRDVFDFDESRDSFETLRISPTMPNVAAAPEPVDLQQDDSQMSSYSDRDDFNYENSPTSESDTSDAISCVTKRSVKSINNIQKKCLIMGRIFKGVKKVELPKEAPVSIVEKVKKPIPKQELDKMFDSLREEPSKAKTNDVTHAAKVVEPLAPSVIVKLDPPKPKPTKPATPKAKTPKQPVAGPTKKTAVPKPKPANRNRSRKSSQIASIEQECGMSMDKIYDLMGVGQRKTQRRCTTNKQKTFAETWSSDEYEDFHTTSDIIALIQQAEQKANKAAKLAKKASGESGGSGGSAKKSAEPTNKLEVVPQVKSKESIAVPVTAKVKRTTFAGVADSDEDEGVTSDIGRQKAAVPRAKIKNRRRTIAGKEDPEPVVVAKKKKSLSPTRAEPSSSSSATKSSSPVKPLRPPPKPLARRKRVASEMLYYWSSSSDEEFGRIKPRETFADDNLEQHGWIVGDSHKKLVTLLAHAKGKKIEDCGVKESVNKKK